MASFSSKTSGFSLVELSIVLVILGLLTGGILGGQSLIHAAELRAVPAEYSQWQTAVNSFRGKYFALPGDMNNATAFWGAADTSDGGECGDPGHDTGTGTQTCNGNGDGHISGSSAQAHEQFRFWQHLANAGLVNGTFTGTEGDGSENHAVISENSPASKYSGGGWSVIFVGDKPGDTWWFERDYGQVLFFGGQHPDYTTLNPLLAPEDAWNIDTKIDDGKPNDGKVIAHFRSICAVADDSSDTEAVYALSDDGNNCSLVFADAL